MEWLIAAVGLLGGLAIALWHHTRRDIQTHKETEQRRVQYGQSKFVTPAFWEKGPQLPTIDISPDRLPAIDKPDAIQDRKPVFPLEDIVSRQDVWFPGFPLVPGKSVYTIGFPGADIEQPAPEIITGARIYAGDGQHGVALKLIDSISEYRSFSPVEGLPFCLSYSAQEKRIELFPIPDRRMGLVINTTEAAQLQAQRTSGLRNYSQPRYSPRDLQNLKPGYFFGLPGTTGGLGGAGASGALGGAGLGPAGLGAATSAGAGLLSALFGSAFDGLL